MQNGASFYSLKRDTTATPQWGTAISSSQWKHKIDYTVFALPPPPAASGVAASTPAGNVAANPGVTVTWTWSAVSSQAQATQFYINLVPTSGSAPSLSYLTSFAAASATSPMSFTQQTGLTPGTPYTVTVIPSNPTSGNTTTPTSTTYTTGAVPPPAPAAVSVSLGAPSFLSPSSGVAQASLTVTPPSTTGGSPLTDYTATATSVTCPTAYASCPTVTASAGALFASPPATTTFPIGLLPGVTYTVSVAAKNVQGTGAGLTATPNVVVPAMVPQPAGSFTAPSFGTTTFVSQAGGSTQQVTIAAPAYNGGALVTAYTIFFTPTNAETGALDRRLQASAFAFPAGLPASLATPVSVPGLVPGISYNVIVQATNGVGSSNSTLAVLSVPPVTPNSPTGVTATAVDSGTVTVAWTAPTWNGGSPVVNYNVTLTGPASGTSTAGLNAGDGSRTFPFLCNAATCSFAAPTMNAYPATNASVTLLTPGGSYTGRVSMITAAGLQSAPALSSTVLLPVSPVTVTASADDPTASVTARWAVTGPTGGSPVTGFLVTVRDQSGAVLATATLPASASNATFPNMPLATRLAVTVTAVTAAQNYPSDPAYAQLSGQAPGRVFAPALTDTGPQSARAAWNASTSASTAPVLNYTLELTPIVSGSNPNAGGLQATGPTAATATGAPSPPTLPASLDLSRVAPGSQYAARVVACNAFGCTPGPYVVFTKPETAAPFLVDVTTPITPASATAIFQPAPVWQPWGLSPASYVVVAAPAALGSPSNGTSFANQATGAVEFAVAASEVTANGFFLANFSVTVPNTAYLVRVFPVYAALGPARGSPSNARAYIAPADSGTWCAVQSPTVPVVLAGVTAATGPALFLGARPNITGAESFTVDIRMNSVGCFDVFDTPRLRSVVAQVAAALNATVARMRIVYLRCAFGAGVAGSPCVGSFDVAIMGRARALRQAAAFYQTVTAIPTATTFGVGQLVLVMTILPVTAAGDASMASDLIYANMMDLSRRQSLIPVGTVGTAQLTSNGAAVRSVVILSDPTPSPAPILKKDDGGGLSGGILAAIIVPVVVGSLLLMCCLYLICCGVTRRRRKDEYIYEHAEVEAFQPVGPPANVGMGVSYTAVPIAQELTYGAGGLSLVPAATTVTQQSQQYVLPGTPAQLAVLPGSPISPPSLVASPAPVGSPTPLLATGQYSYQPSWTTTTTSQQREYYLAPGASPGYP